MYIMVTMPMRRRLSTARTSRCYIDGEPDEYTKSCVSGVQKNLILIIHDAGALEDHRSIVSDCIDSGELLNRRQKERDLYMKRRKFI